MSETISVHNRFELGIFMSSSNECRGLVDAKIRASDKDLPVLGKI